MSVAIDAQVFARLVGAYPERNVLLFEVADSFLEGADSNAWSKPMEWRFVHREGALVELEFHTLDLDAYIRDVDMPPDRELES